MRPTPDAQMPSSRPLLIRPHTGSLDGISLNCAFWHSSGIVESMRLAPLSIVAFAGVAMLLMQMSGLHLHAGEPSGDVGVHGTHLHEVVADGDDHSKAVDVALVDLGIVWSKIMPALMATLPTALAIVWVLHALWLPPTTLIPLRRRSRWRPPLRAPPLSP